MKSYKFDGTDVDIRKKHRIENGITSVIHKVGEWVGIGRNGKAYEVDHVASLPPAHAGDDGTRPDAIGSYAFVVSAKINHKPGLAPDTLDTLEVVLNTGAHVKVSENEIVTPIDELWSGAALKVITSGVNKGKVEATAVASDSYNAIVIDVDDKEKSVIIRVAFGYNASSTGGANGQGVLSLDSNIDEDGDGIVTVDELQSSVLDVNDDGHTNIQDVIKIVNDEVIN